MLEPGLIQSLIRWGVRSAKGRGSCGSARMPTVRPISIHGRSDSLRLSIHVKNLDAWDAMSGLNQASG